MSLVTEVGDLTAAVNLLIEEVDVKKTALDEAVDDAETAAATAVTKASEADASAASASASAASTAEIDATNRYYINLLLMGF
jgi:D-ribose pyranose/furanose isomerase RbsD